MKDLREVQRFSKALVQKEADLGNIDMMEGVLNIVDMNWEMEDKAWWVNEQVSSDGYDSIKDAVDLLGRNNPKLSMTPYGDHPDNRKQAEAIEQALMWELNRMLNRRGSPNKKATKQAAMYGRTVGMLVYLPWQIEALKTLGKDTKREEMALRNGKFMLKVYDSRGVFPYYTDYGLEGVLAKSILPAQEVLDFWGEHNTGELRKKFHDEDLHWVTQFDYWDLDQRTVWVVAHKEGYSATPDEGGIQILHEKLDIPFLPWVVSDLDEELRPMLYSVWKSGQNDLMNVYLSAQSSEVRAYIAAPRLKFEGADPASIKVDYGDPNRPLEVPPGHNVTELRPPGLDPALSEMIARLQGMVSKSTISHNVQTADFGKGAAYASIRELIELTSRRLNDPKAILESFYKDVFTKMLQWIEYQEDSITAYIGDEYGSSNQIQLIAPGKYKEYGYTFDTDNLNFKVEMTPDIPEDQVARHNAANMFVQLGGSKTKALEMVGVTNPQKEIQRAREEMLIDADFQGQAALIQGQYELQLQMAAAQMQQQAAQQFEMQQQQAQQQQQQMQLPSMEVARGSNNMNPAMGGMPPDMAAPGTSSPRRDNPPIVMPPGGK